MTYKIGSLIKIDFNKIRGNTNDNTNYIIGIVLEKNEKYIILTLKDGKNILKKYTKFFIDKTYDSKIDILVQ